MSTLSEGRPALTAGLKADEFARWYWLKAELAAFCREHGISTAGLKRELQERISQFLTDGERLSATRAARRLGTMPDHFSNDSVIGEGWRCGPALGKFLRSQLGEGFRFNADVREFIHRGAGRRLGEVAAVYRESLGRKREIPVQLEYNRHFREYFAANPGASLESAIAAWWQRRDKRREN